MSDKILWKQDDADGAIGRLVLNRNDRYRPGYMLEVGYESMVCTVELERAHLAGLWLALLEEADSLDWAVKAVARETVIRSVMAETGEPREIVAEMVDASASMDQEAVLDLTEGEPTTLRDALERFVDDLGRRLEGQPGSTSGDVLADLNAILAYPYPDGGSAATDALVDALDASGGFPVPTPREFARRVEHQLQARGYRVGKR